MTTQGDRRGSAAAEAPTLELRGVRHKFAARAGRTTVFDGLDLEVRRGEFLAIVGPSGCGKTTLLRVMHGLQQPTAGDVLVGGAPVSSASAAGIAMVFQQDSLLPWRTIWRNVTFGAEMRGRGRAAVDRARAESLLATVGLDGFAEHHPRQLSGGMRQRVNLARALYVDPDVLLMDEPFAALDAQTQEVMQAELLRIWSELQNTVVFVTHRLEEAVYLADRVVVLTPRPARVRTVIDVDLERPRPLAVKRTPEFNALVEAVTTALRGGDDGDHRA